MTKSEPKLELKEKDTKRKKGVKAPHPPHPHHLRNYEGDMAKCRPKNELYVELSEL